LIVSLAFSTSALAGETVRDERRLWSDGSPQEVWSYDGSILEENLILRELFWEDGTKRRHSEFMKGVQHGATRTWYADGNKEIEETWVEGGLHGTVTHWPNPGDDSRRKKQLKPKLEAIWADGKPHGVWREWESWGEHRWLRIEKSYTEGELDGFESVWRRKDSMTRKHAWKNGQLDGRQLGWDYNGQMAYQYNFRDGAPEGPQRKYEGDTIVQELFFVDGRLHGTMTWESWLEDLGPNWRNGLRSDHHHNDDGTLIQTKRYAFEPDKQLNNEGALQFHGDDELVDTTKYREDGSRETVITPGSKQRILNFYPSGRLKRIQGGTSYSGPVFEWYPDGTLFREEHWDSHSRTGLWKIYDQRGRVVQVQRWDYNLKEQTVTVWHDNENKASEGQIEHYSDSPNGRKTGTWTYWRADGSLLRTEEYGPGPYSGNRAFIVKMVEWDEQERPHFEGSERELILYSYDEDDPDIVVRRRTIKLIDRSRAGLESWNSAAQTIERRPVQKPTELPSGAATVELLAGRGVVLADESFRSDGSPKHTRRYGKNGLYNGLQEGWYPDGTPAFKFQYSRGRLVRVEEWWSDGSPRLVATAGSSGITSLDASDKRGKHWVLEDLVWRGPPELLEHCQIWKFDPEAPRVGP